jgi:hypothetical protein
MTWTEDMTMKLRKLIFRVAALALVAALSLPAAGRTHAAADTLVPNVSTDLVALINGGSVPFATSDMGAGGLPLKGRCSCNGLGARVEH